MKFELWNNKSDTVRFKLSLTPDKTRVNLTAVDEDGIPISHILSVDSDGLHLPTGIKENIGLPLDNKERIKLFNY